MAAQVAHILRKKEAILRLERYLDCPVVAELANGKEMRGVLKGFDSNANLVLYNAIEIVIKEGTTTERRLGAAIVRGGLITAVFPEMHEIANPFGE